MRKIILLFILFLFSMTVFAQQKIALLEPRVGEGSSDVSSMEKAMVRGELRKAIVNFPGFEAITRTDIDQMMNEFKFQQTGMVSEEQIKKVGEMSGADYICVSTLTKSNTEFYLESYLIHLESGTMSNPASQYGELMDGKLANMLPVCQMLAQELLGFPTTTNSFGTTTTSRTKKDYVENAFGVNMKMIWVEGGEFMMGCTSEQGRWCNDDEKNIHRVTVDGFYIGMLEVTQEQWEKVMELSVYQQWEKANFREGKPIEEIGKNHPINCVSWNDAMEFCRRLSMQTGRTYTLPTEAQWEYAARGGNRGEREIEGEEMVETINDVAWTGSDCDGSLFNCNYIHRCGTLEPNSLGVYDMLGNVYEWCSDWYAGSYVKGETHNPTGPLTGTLRVRRGGSAYSLPFDSRVSARESGPPTYYEYSYENGFRVVYIP